MRIAGRYAELGKPAVPEHFPAKDADLTARILDAAKAYAGIRTKDDAAAKEAAEKWSEEKRRNGEAKQKSRKGEPRMTRADIEAIPPEKRTPEQIMALSGIHNVVPVPPTPPPTPERLAAEKKVDALIAELVRRGQPVRDFALTNGLAPVLFR